MVEAVEVRDHLGAEVQKSTEQRGEMGHRAGTHGMVINKQNLVGGRLSVCCTGKYKFGGLRTTVSHGSGGGESRITAPADLGYGEVSFWKVTDDLMMEGTGLVSLTSSLISGSSHLPTVPQPNTIILGLGSNIRIWGDTLKALTVI